MAKKELKGIVKLVRGIYNVETHINNHNARPIVVQDKLANINMKHDAPKNITNGIIAFLSALCKSIKY